jgi:hypothetical protein
MATAIESRPFTEVASALNKALDDIKAKKYVFDEASKAVNEASSAYQTSVDNAQFLREELEKSLNDSMGQKSGRVRVSG